MLFISSVLDVEFILEIPDLGNMH